MATHALFVDIDRREPVIGVSDSSIAALPGFTQEDTLHLRIYLLAGFSRLTDYTRVATSGITLQIALGDKVGNETTYYTQQFTWVANDDLADPYWEGSLPMNTEAIETLIGAQEEENAWFEVKMLDGGYPRTVLSKRVTIHAAVIKDGGMSEPAEPTPLSVEAANAIFLPKDYTGHWILRNEDDPTKAVDIYVDSNGSFQADPIA